jgi:DNA-binding response OmpR family regulator
MDAQSSAKPFRILVAEDDDAMRDLLVGWLREAGFDVTECVDGLDLRCWLEWSVLSGEADAFDLVVSDIHMPLCSALDVLEEIFECDGIPPTILITAFESPWTYAAARYMGAVTVLEKPFERRRLLSEIQRLGGRNPVAPKPLATTASP